MINSGNLCQFQINPALRCYNYGCQNGGTCTILNTCNCLPGYYGNLCEFSLSSSTNSPATTTTLSKQLNFCPTQGFCQNGGTCYQVENSTFFACNCLNGFSGIFCQFISLTIKTTVSTSLSTTQSITMTSAGQGNFIIVIYLIKNWA